MLRYLRPHYLLTFGGLVLGLAAGIFVIDFQPAFVAWIVAGGVGLSVGAYIAAISSGEPLAGSGADRRTNWTLEELYGNEDSPPAAPTTEGNGHRPT
jgi:hypothetical protein